MDKNLCELWACCFSENNKGSISFGVEYDSNAQTIEGLGYDWFYEGMTDSFWENFQEFEDGIQEAKDILLKDSSISYRDALFEVFGNFKVAYEVNGIVRELEMNIDINKEMYRLLLQL